MALSAWCRCNPVGCVFSSNNCPCLSKPEICSLQSQSTSEAQKQWICAPATDCLRTVLLMLLSPLFKSVIAKRVAGNLWRSLFLHRLKHQAQDETSLLFMSSVTAWCSLGSEVTACATRGTESLTLAHRTSLQSTNEHTALHLHAFM